MEQGTEVKLGGGIGAVEDWIKAKRTEPVKCCPNSLALIASAIESTLKEFPPAPRETHQEPANRQR